MANGGLPLRTETDQRSPRWLWLLVVGLVACLALAVLFTPGTPGPEGPHRRAAELMHTWVDAERARHGLHPLDHAEDMALVSEAWSARMADMRSLEHNPDVGDQLCCWSTVTENVAFAEAYRLRLIGDPIERLTRDLHEGLLSSPGHRANLLDPNVGEIGIGVHVDGRGTVWITQTFRQRAGAPAA